MLCLLGVLFLWFVVTFLFGVALMVGELLAYA